jgi:hypothetical protein
MQHSSDDVVRLGRLCLQKSIGMHAITIKMREAVIESQSILVHAANQILPAHSNEEVVFPCILFYLL